MLIHNINYSFSMLQKDIIKCTIIKRFPATRDIFIAWINDSIINNFKIIICTRIYTGEYYLPHFSK